MQIGVVYMCLCVRVSVCVWSGGGWVGGGVGVRNTYELLNLKALKIAMCCENRMFQCMGKIKVPFEIPHKMSPPGTFQDYDIIIYSVGY